jgi:hypothetical protein
LTTGGLPRSSRRVIGDLMTRWVVSYLSEALYVPPPSFRRNNSTPQKAEAGLAMKSKTS